MNILPFEKRCAVIRALVEGCSIRSTVRMTGVAKNTIQGLTRQVGEACLEFQDQALRNLPCKRIQCDEVWAFCFAKDKNQPDSMRGMPGVGIIWTWTALCSDTKLMVSWRIGARDAANAHTFMQDVAARLANRVQLTTDGNRLYVNAANDAFGADVDFAQLVKLYGNESEPKTRYSPGKCLGARKEKCDSPGLSDTGGGEGPGVRGRFRGRHRSRVPCPRLPWARQARPKRVVAARAPSVVVHKVHGCPSMPAPSVGTAPEGLAGSMPTTSAPAFPGGHVS